MEWKNDTKYPGYRMTDLTPEISNILTEAVVHCIAYSPNQELVDRCCKALRAMFGELTVRELIKTMLAEKQKFVTDKK
jgi:hypothetical protein